MRPAVFLDRDGTLVEEAGYIERVERMVLFPWTVDAVRLLRRAGYLAVVVTNQAGVAKGVFPERFVAEGRAYLEGRLAQGGAALDGYYYCPHLKEAAVAAYRTDCQCRKPRPGMVMQAARDRRRTGPQRRRPRDTGQDRIRRVRSARAAGRSPGRCHLCESGGGRRVVARPSGHMRTCHRIQRDTWARSSH
jgi:D,D-heptose 1,7-bisphosphate phosphatase